ncbi:MAG: isochorismatase family protein [Beijerinckiaceae bacterium]|nr:isochorismatase family protein [Beijerinckiaceae bacterium]
MTIAPKTIDRARSALLLIDFQQRLMPAIFERDMILSTAAKLAAAARLFRVPTLVTEQNPKSLGATVADLPLDGHQTLGKSEFDATASPDFPALWPEGRDCAVIAGCEAHVCVLQTALGLLDKRIHVFIVEDAIGSRQPASRRAAIDRLRAYGADIVTAEMVVFEWLGTAEHPKFKDALALIK